MNGAEAAASLFGPDNSSSDPFASLGEDNVASGDQTSDDHHTAAPPQDQLSPPSVQSGFSDVAQATSLAEETSQPYAPAQSDGSQSYGLHTTYLSSGLQQTSSLHSSGQYQSASVQQGTLNASSWPAYSPGLESSKSPPSQNTYNPYAPVSAGGTSVGLHDATTHSPYNSPGVNATPHTRTGSALYSTAVPPSYPNVSPPLTVNVPVPPAPTSASTIKRPKVSNAYDPPFPVTKSKRVSSRPSQHGLAGAGSYQGGYAYNTPPIPHAQHQSSIPPPSVGTTGVPFTGMLRQESPYHLNGPPYLASTVSPGPVMVDGLPTQGPAASQSTWTAGARSVSGYYPEEKAFRAGTAAGSPTYYPSEPSIITGQTSKPHMDNFSSIPPSRPNANTDNGASTQASTVKNPSPKALVSSDYDDIRRTYSPGMPIHPETTTLLGTQVPTSPKVSVGAHGNGTYFSSHAYEHKSQSPTLPDFGGSVLSPPQTPLINHDLYGPPKSSHVNNGAEYGAISPGSQLGRSSNGRQSTKPQPGIRPPSRVDALRGRSMSNGSVLASSHSESSYAPSEHYRPQRPNGDPAPVSQIPFSTGQSLHPAYEPPSIHNTFAKVQAPYAPSPSLLGTNDPLGRASARVPVVSFGFGGKLVTCFHGSDGLTTGFDVALSSRGTTNVQIHNLSKVIPRPTLDIAMVSFPGPLFSDSGASGASLVRTTASSQKNRKAGITKYLSERAEEIFHGLSYLNPGSAERRQAEGKLILVKLLKIMVENDGRLSGSPSIEASVRSALVSRLDGTLATPTPEFTTIADAHVTYSETASVDAEPVIATNTLRSSSLDKIQEFLLRGERRQACHYALDEKLWAHAMVIASGIDKEAWQEVTNEFLKAELGAKVEGTLDPSYHKVGSSLPVQTNGREALRVAYSLYSGQGSAAIQELVPQTMLSRGVTKLQIQNIGAPHTTPRTPNFHPPAPPVNIPPETLVKWADIMAMMISSTINTEASLALTALGDQLLAHQYVEAAHACYLLAPQSSLMGGLGNPSVRIVLIGSKSPATMPNFFADPEPIIFSEIVEFALSLSPTAKGQEAFAGLPHLQAYRFIRAAFLAEMGEMQLASRYCEAITASLSRPSPYFTPTLSDHLRGLADRISGTSDVDKANSWIGGKIAKPSLDSIGGWLEGRFTKLVTGDVESPTRDRDAATIEERTFSGPFSTISSATPSARSSPQPMLPNIPPAAIPRSGSALTFSSHTSYVPVDRASSAMDYYKPKATSAPRVVSAGPGITSFSQSQSPRAGLHERSQNSSSSSTDSFTPKTSDPNGSEQEDTWWGRSNPYEYNNNASAKTPTATTFMRVDESVVRTTPDGFISLMDAPTFSGVTSKSAHESLRSAVPEEDVEDLGLSNSKKERDATENGQATHATQPEPQKLAEPEKTESKAPASTTGGSWLSRWWNRDGAPGPVKASLGEESAFYYDKELKRWVNKKGGSDSPATKAVPPPPPSRPHTASPAMAGPRSALSKPPITEAGSISAIDLTTSPPSKSTLHVQSRLAPPAADSAPSSPTGSRFNPNLPPGRPRSQASTKRNLRSRYVDVLQSDGNVS